VTIRHDRFIRVLLRGVEIAEQPGLSPVIKTLYDETFAAPVKAHLDADAHATAALVANDSAIQESRKALALLNGPFKVARTSLKSILPETTKVIPRTLKALSTDTDKLSAIRWVLGTLEEQTGATWADALITGEFGESARAAIVAIEGAITAGKALTAARRNVAETFLPAYKKFLDFKHIVRDSLGARSKEYRRLHLRTPAASDEETKPEGARKAAVQAAPVSGAAAIPPQPVAAAEPKPVAAAEPESSSRSGSSVTPRLVDPASRAIVSCGQRPARFLPGAASMASTHAREGRAPGVAVGVRAWCDLRGPVALRDGHLPVQPSAGSVAHGVHRGGRR